MVGRLNTPLERTRLRDILGYEGTGAQTGKAVESGFSNCAG
jgi:hypothetical protein